MSTLCQVYAKLFEKRLMQYYLNYLYHYKKIQINNQAKYFDDIENKVSDS